MEKAIQRLRTAYPGLIVRCFPGFGHGEIINHPALLATLVLVLRSSQPVSYTDAQT